MTEYIVYRFLNLFYFLLIFIYAMILLAYLIIKRKENAYKQGLIIFILTSIILTAMEFYGTLVGIRIFYIGEKTNIAMQLMLQIIMGLGEGGTMATLTYLIIEELYKKNYRKCIAYFGSYGILMSIVAITSLGSKIS